MGLLLVWRETGLRVVVSSIMMQRPSLSGSMRKINFASSPWRMVAMSRESLRDCAVVSKWFRTQSRKSLEKTSAWTRSMVMFTLAQPILAGMRASVHIDLPGWTRHSIDKLKARCEELHLQPRGTRGESGGQTGHTYDISNKHRLGYSEVQLVQKMIDGVNTLWKEDKEFQKQYNVSL